MAKKSNKSSKSAVTAAKPKNTEPIVPDCIAKLRAIAKSYEVLKDVPENQSKIIERLIAGTNKVADRITAGLGTAAKKAEREAKAKVRAEAKEARVKAANDKKLAKITDLRAKLSALEAETTDDKK